MRLGNLVEISNGYAFKSSQYVDNGIRVIRITNVQKGNIEDNDPKYYDKSTLPQLLRYTIEEGDILMSLTGNVGRVGLFPKELTPAYLNQRVARIRVTSSDLDSQYLFYVLNSDRFENDAINNSAGVAQLNLSTKWINEYEIPLPPLEEQKKIATILDAADDYRQKTKALIDKYDQLTQSLFLDMFGDPVTNPMGWEYKILSELVSKLGDGIHGTPNYSEDGEYYFINGNNLHEGRIFIDDKTKRVSKAEFLKHRKELNSNTVLVSINGTIGKVAFYNNEPIILGKSACYFNLIEDVINRSFLYYLLFSPYFKRYAGNQATGSTIKNVSLKTMRGFPIPYPSLNLQNQFAERVAQVEKQKQQAEASLVKAEELFSSLLQRAFKGELSS